MDLAAALSGRKRLLLAFGLKVSARCSADVVFDGRRNTSRVLSFCAVLSSSLRLSLDMCVFDPLGA